MQNLSIILLALTLLAYAATRSTEYTKPPRFPHLKGWQKIFGLVAIIGAMLILMNPELLALGILGDTAFFDMLVLALSLQMHTFVRRAFHRCVDVLARCARSLGIPSPGLRYLLFVLTPFVTGAVATIQKA